MFGWGMNILILLALAWVFALSEDIWLNRTLGYQIQAEGEKRGVSPKSALSSFKRYTKRLDFLEVGVGLSLIIISFPFGIESPVMWLLAFVGGLVVAHYIWRKISLYNKAAQDL
jgi:hypothetical protein